jgi:hypothetical protein
MEPRIEGGGEEYFWEVSLSPSKKTEAGVWWLPKESP